MIYISIIYTSNLGFGIVVFDQERKQSRFKGSIEGAPGSPERAQSEHRGSIGEHRASTKGVSKEADKRIEAAVGGSLKWSHYYRLGLPLLLFEY